MERLVLSIVEHMEAENMISNEKHDEYVYALTMMFEKWISLISAFIIGLILGEPVSTLIFTVAFLSLRKRTGGFHAEHFYQCYIASMAAVVLAVCIARFLSQHMILMFLLLVPADIIIGVIGTVNHPNLDLDNEEFRASRKAARWILLVENVLMIIALFAGIAPVYVNGISAAIIMCATLMGLAKILKQEVKNYGEQEET